MAGHSYIMTTLSDGFEFSVYGIKLWSMLTFLDKLHHNSSRLRTYYILAMNGMKNLVTDDKFNIYE